MPTLYPTDPQNWLRTEAERKGKEQERKEKADKERREKTRFIITTVLSAVAAIAAVAGVIFNLLERDQRIKFVCDPF